jgi:hypothetical protein
MTIADWARGFAGGLMIGGAAAIFLLTASYLLLLAVLALASLLIAVSLLARTARLLRSRSSRSTTRAA